MIALPTLLTALKARSTLSREQLKTLIHRGCCSVNGKKELLASRPVDPSDKITLIEQAIEEPGEVRTLWEDEWLLAVDKPAMAVSTDIKKGILLHRLDKETSGVLLFAKNKKAAHAMEELFRKRQMAKKYVAWVDGITKESGVIRKPLVAGKRIAGQVLMEIGEGLPAETAWKKVQEGEKSTLLQITPTTGRTHQIRVHLNSIGHPILGDYLYGNRFRCSFIPPRILLHAASLSFVHPMTKQKITIQSPLPKEFHARSHR